MDDLELLKKDWDTNKGDYKKFSEDEIYKMIKKKSISISHLLFGIGLFEIFIWMSFDYFYTFNYPISRYIIFIIFVGLMIYGYYKIRTEDNVKKLMKSILRLRNCVILYVILTLGIILFDIIIDFDSHVHHLLAGWESGEKGEKYSVSPKDVTPGFISYLMFVLMASFFIGILILIYRKTYGKLLKKLKLNYTELTKLNESDA